jgi:hypothetical protein
MTRIVKSRRIALQVNAIQPGGCERSARGRRSRRAGHGRKIKVQIPVPVLLTLHGWDPDSGESVTDWMVGKLAARPGTRPPRQGARARRDRPRRPGQTAGEVEALRSGSSTCPSWLPNLLVPGAGIAVWWQTRRSEPVDSSAVSADGSLMMVKSGVRAWGLHPGRGQQSRTAAGRVGAARLFRVGWD